jgi:hypothetical protein
MIAPAIRARLEDLFRDLFDPNTPAERLTRHLTDDYRQDVDGRTLDLSGFVAHARALKSTLAEAAVSFETVIGDERRAASLHVVSGRKLDGTTVRVRVYAFFEFADGRVRRVDEVTRLLEGEEDDRDLGSRTAD